MHRIEARARARGFTLVEIMIVVAIIMVVAAIAVIQLGRARITMNEASALNSVRLVVKSCQFYFMVRQAYPTALNGLGAPTSNPPYISDTSLLAGNKQGYQFVYVPAAGPTPDTFTLRANPLSHGVTGTRHFMTTEALAIYATTEDRDATTADPLIP